MRDLSLDEASFSLLGSATMLGYALTQIPSGFLADILGGRKTLAYCQILTGVFCIFFTFSETASSATASRFLLGLTLAANVPAYKIFSTAVPAHKYAQYCSILTGFGTVGTLMAATPLVWLSGLTGWHIALLIAGVLTICVGLIIGTMLDDGAQTNISVPFTARMRELKNGIVVVATMKNFWFLVIWFMFMIGNLFTLVATWWGSFLMQAGGLSKESAGLSISIMSLSPLPLLMVFPWLSDNVLHSRRIFLMLAALLETLVLGYICLRGDSGYSFWELTIAGIIINIATQAMGPLVFTMIKESVPPSALASASGFLNCSGPVMSAILQSIFGAILAWQLGQGAGSSAAYSHAFILLAIGSGIAFIATLFMKDTWQAR
jgi:MFS family permease